MLAINSDNKNDLKSDQELRLRNRILTKLLQKPVSVSEVVNKLY